MTATLPATLAEDKICLSHPPDWTIAPHAASRCPYSRTFHANEWDITSLDCIRPITGVWRQRTWAPANAGIEWKPIPDAPVPADSTRQRMRQIRLLSRRFDAHSIDYEGGRWELRLVPKPLYCWESKESDAVVRGALLALCQGTDVEILLMIEARKTASGPLWHYACAQFGDFAMHVRLDGIDVWSVSRAPIRDLRGPFLQDVVERRDAPEDAETPK